MTVNRAVVRLPVVLPSVLIVMLVAIGAQAGASPRLVPQAVVTSTVTPDADGNVVDTSPTTSYGTSAILRVDASPITRTYVRFTLPVGVTSAVLRVWANSAQTPGYVVHAVADATWTEAGLTYNSAPPLGTAIGSSGATTAGAWTSVDVTSAVTANGPLAFGLDTTSSTSLSLSAREGLHPPELVVTTGVPTPTPTATPTAAPSPTVSPAPAPTGAALIAAAGDIACDPLSSSFNGGDGTSSSCRQKWVSDLIVSRGVAKVLTLGDNQYYCGSYDGYMGAYDKSWGRLKNLTAPVSGNHEYLTNGGSSASTGCDTSNAGAAGYFKYFGALAGTAGQGWYSFDVGAWHLIALSTQCSAVGGCSASSPQGKWLAADLAAHKNTCTLAYMHIPLFSSGGRASSNSKTFWQLLYDNGADLVLTGHDHTYERFLPQTPAGAVDDARGLVEFVAGSGGANHTSFTTIAANSVVRDSTTFGALFLTLKPTSYSWEFAPAVGKGTFRDSGSASCH